MNPTFNEKTKLPNFIHVIFAIQSLIFLFLVIENRSNLILKYVFFCIILLGFILLIAKLTITISKQSIKYNFYPFTFKKKIDWSEIDRVKIIKVSAISDFSGWGIRFSKKYGWGYITSAEYAIQIFKKNGKSVVFSIKNIKLLNTFLKDNNLG